MVIVGEMAMEIADQTVEVSDMAKSKTMNQVLVPELLIIEMVMDRAGPSQYRFPLAGRNNNNNSSSNGRGRGLNNTSSSSRGNGKGRGLCPGHTLSSSLCREQSSFV